MENRIDDFIWKTQAVREFWCVRWILNDVRSFDNTYIVDYLSKNISPNKNPSFLFIQSIKLVFSRHYECVKKPAALLCTLTLNIRVINNDFGLGGGGQALFVM